MGRNYFSKKGGPYFINNGFSAHDHSHKPGESHEDIKPDKTVFVSLLIGFGIVLTVIASLLSSF